MKSVISILSFLCVIDCYVIETQYGPIRGTNKTSALGKNYYSFQKIPYMKPPVGTLRFRNAEVPDNWIEPLDCTQEGPRFPQIDYTLEYDGGTFGGDLNSMHINVYTNNLTPEIPYPVLVWIHGGGFRTGSGRTDIYGPDYLMEEDVILVTFNYRLGAFGFLSLDDPEIGIPGNNGFKDQVLALKWIKTNINKFGGDSMNITIFGQSSGGGCAHFHMISDSSKDLFQRSIIMSGSAFNNMYSAIPRRNWALKLSRALGYDGINEDKEVLKFLEAAEPEAIFFASSNLLTAEESNFERLLGAFGPTIEPYSTSNSFMLDHPEKIAINSWGNNINILIGTVSMENTPIVNVVREFPEFLSTIVNFTSYVPSNLNFSSEKREEHGRTLKAMYYGEMEPSVTNIDGALILTNEFAFIHSVHRVVKQRWSSGGSGKSFVYRFDVNSDNNCFSPLNKVDPIYREPIHMDDLCYLFKTSFAAVPQPNSLGWNITQQMVSIFTKFASSGDPGVKDWLPSSGMNAQPPLWGINLRETDSYISELPEVRRMMVWDTFYETSTSMRIKGFYSLIFASIMTKLFI